MKNSIAFTHKAINTMRSNGVRKEFSVRGMKGLRLYVNKDNSKVFHFRLKKQAKKILTYNESNLQDIKRIYYEYLLKIEKGEYIYSTTAKDVPTVEEIFFYNLKRKLKSSTIQQYEYRYKTYISNTFAHQKITDCHSHDIQLWYNKLCSEHGIATANENLILLKSIFNYAVAKEYIDKNRCMGVKINKIRAVSEIFSLQDIKQIHNIILTMPSLPQNILLLALYTGARKSNILSMHWNEINIREQIWTISSQKTKTNVKYTIPLIGKACELLNSISSNKVGYVFKSDAGTKGYITDISKYMKKYFQELHRIPTMHDFRRNLATCLNASGASDIITKRILNHSTENNVTARYIGNDNKVLLEALENAFLFMNLSMDYCR